MMSMLLFLLCWTPVALGADPFITVLGIAQDAGHPQAGCERSCCSAAWRRSNRSHRVASAAIVDPDTGQTWMLDATPDFPEQMHSLGTKGATSAPDGILLTHAHMGHYAGLLHLGREAMGATEVPVYAMPRMHALLTDHAPWSQLVALENISLHLLAAEHPVKLNDRISVTPLLVPHRDEFSETVAFVIQGPHRSVLYLPDIDKWSRWDRPIEDVLAEVDAALLDGTFFAGNEIPGRDMQEIPHPFIVESLDRFGALPLEQRQKVLFFHLNHTNPVLDRRSPEHRAVRRSGMGVAAEGQEIPL